MVHENGWSETNAPDVLGLTARLHLKWTLLTSDLGKEHTCPRTLGNETNLCYAPKTGNEPPIMVLYLAMQRPLRYVSLLPPYRYVYSYSMHMVLLAAD